MAKYKKHKFDLEERTLTFSKRIIKLCKAFPKNMISVPLVNQLIRSGTSIGANYREANDALSKKDFIHRMKISRRECKETVYWIKLLIEASSDENKEMSDLLSECIELKKILSTIINNSVSKGG